MSVHELSDDDARHLLRRTSFAATPQQIQTLRGQNREAAFTQLWNMSAAASLQASPAFVQQPWRNTALAYQQSSTGVADYETRRAEQLRVYAEQTERLRQAWFTQMVSGSGALRENLALFLHGMVGSSTTAVEVPHALHARNVLLWRMSMTSLPELLEQLVLDPAMMIQIGMDGHGLDRVSDRPAKLVLDYWTVGSGQYADRDVEELSRALTGWSLGPAVQSSAMAIDAAAPRTAQRTSLIPRFDRQNFDDDSKTIMGVTDHFDAPAAIRMLALQPATAQRFSQQLIRYFGVSDPQQALQRRLQSSYLASRGSMQVLLRELLTSDEFWSTASRWSLIKSPLHLAVGACRQLNLPASNMSSVATATELNRWLAACGQTLFDTPNNGEGSWPDQEAWISPADKLAIRCQLPKVLLGETLPLGLTATPITRATTPVSLPRWSGTSAELLERLDPAPGLDVHLLGVRRTRDAVRMERSMISSTISSIMATPQYQLA